MSNRPKIILLCGGKGERLKPLTIDMPKPLIHLNKKPIISYIIEHLKSFKLDEFIITGCQKENAVCAAVSLVGFALQPAVIFHPLEQRSDGVWIAAHGTGDLALGHAGRVAFAEGAQHGELIRRGAGVADAAAEGLVQPVPRAAQQQRQALALGGVDGESTRKEVICKYMGHGR